MTTRTETIRETVKNEFNVYSKDGKKLLGSHPTRKAAVEHDNFVNLAKSGKTFDEGFAKDVATGAIEVVEGGRYLLSEYAGDLARMPDAQVKKLRAKMVEKRNEKRTAHGALPQEDKYSSPEGSALLDDLYYYGSLISRLESEMQCRMLSLD